MNIEALEQLQKVIDMIDDYTACVEKDIKDIKKAIENYQEELING